MKVYVRVEEFEYEGSDIVFATTTEEKAFAVPKTESTCSLYCIHVYEDEKLVEQYYWRKDANQWISWPDPNKKVEGL